MKAGRIHYFGPPNAIVIDEIPCPTPKEGELVVRVVAAGVADTIGRDSCTALHVVFFRFNDRTRRKPHRE